MQWEESSIDRLTAVDLRLGSWTGFKCPDWPDRSRLGPPNSNTPPSSSLSHLRHPRKPSQRRSEINAVSCSITDYFAQRRGRDGNSTNPAKPPPGCCLANRSLGSARAACNGGFLCLLIRLLRQAQDVHLWACLGGAVCSNAEMGARRRSICQALGRQAVKYQGSMTSTPWTHSLIIGHALTTTRAVRTDLSW